MSLPLLERSTYGTKYEHLGSGSFGDVYRRSSEYAAKVMRTDARGGVARLELKEASTMQRLRHPNVVQLVDIVFGNGVIELVMPLARGTLLDSMKSGKMSMQDRIDAMYQVGLGLQYLHSVDVIHQDLKPENVLLFSGGQKGQRYVVSDLGMSLDGFCKRTRASRNDIVTIWYRAPEIFLGCDYDSRSDLWSLGLVYLELFDVAPRLRRERDNDNHLDAVFRTFGYPNPTNWPAVVNCPGYDKEFSNIKSKPLLEKDFESVFGANDPIGARVAAVVHALTELDPSRRTGLHVVLEDELFDGSRETMKRFWGVEPLEASSCEEKMSSNEPPPLSHVDNSPNYLPETLNGIARMLFGMGRGNSTTDREVRVLAFTILRRVKELHWTTLPEGGKDGLSPVAAACLIVAAKLRYPVGQALPYPADENITAKVVEYENRILTDLRFDVSLSTVYDFIQLYQKYQTKEAHELNYDLCLLSFEANLDFTHFPHEIALACLSLSSVFYDAEYSYASRERDPVVEQRLDDARSRLVRAAQNSVLWKAIATEETRKTYNKFADTFGALLGVTE